MLASNESAARIDGGGNDPVRPEPAETDGRTDNVHDGIYCANFMESDLISRLAMHFSFGNGHSLENPDGQTLLILAQGTSFNHGPDIPPVSVFMRAVGMDFMRVGMRLVTMVMFPVVMGMFPMVMGMFPMFMGVFSTVMGMFPMFMGMFSMVMGMFPMFMGMFPMFMGMFSMVMGMFSMVMGMFSMVMGMFSMIMGVFHMVMGVFLVRVGVFIGFRIQFDDDMRAGNSPFLTGFHDQFKALRAKTGQAVPQDSLRHTRIKKGGEGHVSADAGWHVDIQDFHVFSPSQSFMMRFARQAAPKPLSMFMTPTPEAQLFNMPNSAETPPKLAP